MIFYKENAHGQNQRGVGSRVGSGVGWGGGSEGRKMETTVLEQQFKKGKKKENSEASIIELQGLVREFPWPYNSQYIKIKFIPISHKHLKRESNV